MMNPYPGSNNSLSSLQNAQAGSHPNLVGLAGRPAIAPGRSPHRSNCQGPIDSPRDLLSAGSQHLSASQLLALVNQVFHKTVPYVVHSLRECHTEDEQLVLIEIKSVPWAHSSTCTYRGQGMNTAVDLQGQDMSSHAQAPPDAASNFARRPASMSTGNLTDLSGCQQPGASMENLLGNSMPVPLRGVASTSNIWDGQVGR
jgi:hypothetical protein